MSNEIRKQAIEEARLKNAYDTGYGAGVARGVHIANAFYAATCIGGFVILYNDQIKEYGKYVIGKFKKRRV